MPLDPKLYDETYTASGVEVPPLPWYRGLFATPTPDKHEAGVGEPFAERPPDPRRNQAEFGRPQSTPTGEAFKRGLVNIISHPHYLPGPYHFTGFAGVVAVAPPATPRMTYRNSQGFGGSASIKISPPTRRVPAWLTDPNIGG
jgi:hypothetical protein